ncbi:MAG: DUF839 domain-containing protein [Actinobacteria bacterium]|nr:DUF839 domain-containing protein [Actinomycetota bacterium]
MRKLAAGAAAAVAGLAVTGVAIGQIASGVPGTNPTVGSTPSLFASGFGTRVVAEGVDPLENPSGITKLYGYLDDNADPLARTRTEPDENLYLRARHVGGPTAGYDYGSHFLIQGHENGAGKAYLTRINLDVTEPSHRITLLSPGAPDGTTGLSSMDGDAYDPFSGDVLFTSEAGSSGAVVTTKLRWSGTTPPPLAFQNGSIGRAGYEGAAVDKRGDVYLVEDSGGSGVTDNGATTKVKQPNSFVYRFVPSDPRNLSAGKLQALQVSVDGTPIAFHDRAVSATAARDDALGEPIRRLHSGETLQARWVTVHDTATDGTASFDANALAKSAGATPLKRPENGKFVPASDFRSFVFVETGDTDKTAGEYPGAAERGAWGAILRLDMPHAGADSGTIRTLELGDAQHAAFDNVTFLDKRTLLTAEDRGDTLHDQLNTLDSIWSFDITQPKAAINADAQRLVALGRDPEASGASGPTSEDNEPTGLLVSDGDDSIGGLLGAEDPAKLHGVRAFFTQQHGENHTFELLLPHRHGRR